MILIYKNIIYYRYLYKNNIKEVPNELYNLANLRIL